MACAATLTEHHRLPFVESSYTGRFKSDSSSNPKLKELRKRDKLDDLVAPGRASSTSSLPRRPQPGHLAPFSWGLIVDC
jgi:hypothetical protein